MKTEQTTIAEVASAAGVGVATVDRIINGRAAVRPETALRVLQAAEALGFRGAGLIRKRISESGRKRRLGILLQKSGSEFYQLLAQAVAQAGKDAPAAQGALVEYMDDLTPRRVVAQMRAMAAKVDALALVATEHPAICAAVDELGAQGLPIFSLVSDVGAAGLAGHVGIDNAKVGRTAAWAIANLSRRPGKIAVMVGSHRYACQEECETSFRAYFAEREHGFQILDTLVSLEDRHLAEESIHELLHQHPDLSGFYLAVGHDLTPSTGAALADGYLSMVISHPRELMAAELVAAMLRSVDGEGGAAPRRIVVPLQVFTPENV